MQTPATPLSKDSNVEPYDIDQRAYLKKDSADTLSADDIAAALGSFKIAALKVDLNFAVC